MDSKVVSRAIHRMEAVHKRRLMHVHAMEVEAAAAVHGTEAAVKRRAMHIHGMEAGAFI